MYTYTKYIDSTVSNKVGGNKADPLTELQGRT